jgi:hypothetical protein
VNPIDDASIKSQNADTAIPSAAEGNPFKSDTAVEMELLQTHTLTEILPDWE